MFLFIRSLDFVRYEKRIEKSIESRIVKKLANDSSLQIIRKNRVQKILVPFEMDWYLDDGHEKNHFSEGINASAVHKHFAINCIININSKNEMKIFAVHSVTNAKRI